jgi:ribosomal-protein-alanine N-acetyltransferase
MIKMPPSSLSKRENGKQEILINSSQGRYMTENGLAKIRKFNLEDIGPVLEIETQAFPKTAYSRELLLSYAERLPDTFVVIEIDRDIVGYMIFDSSGHIHSTAVKAVHRRKGLGRRLFMHALQCVNKKIWLEVRSKNMGAIEFYKALGMKIMRRIPNYYGSDDALIMALNQSGCGRISIID